MVDIIEGRAMLKMVEEDPALSKHFINYLVMRCRRIEQDLIDHMFNFSEKRVARTLLLLARSRQGDQSAALLDKIGQDTLAVMVGTTRSRINIFMNKFRKLGLIHYNGGLTVHDSLASVLSD
jgi:CRP/FNR family transcriptional regulator, cyclic AMP receptor protein